MSTWDPETERRVDEALEMVRHQPLRIQDHHPWQWDAPIPPREPFDQRRALDVAAAIVAFALALDLLGHAVDAGPSWTRLAFMLAALVVLGISVALRRR